MFKNFHVKAKKFWGSKRPTKELTEADFDEIDEHEKNIKDLLAIKQD